MKSPWKGTLRVRLTLLYAGGFFLAGLVIVAGLYLFFGHTLRNHTPLHAPPELFEQLAAQAHKDHTMTMRAVLNASVVALLAIAATAAGFGWLLAARAVRPLHNITATARRVAERNLHERIALQGPDDEIKDLADTFDAMLERLDQAFDSQRRFVANASHELRTPLTINRALIEVALVDTDDNEPLRQLATRLLTVNQRHERLIDGLLTLAGSEGRLHTHDPVDLSQVVEHAVAESHATARHAGVRIRTTLAPAPVAGDPVLLERLAHNLLDNAIRYNLPEGWVHVITGLDGPHAIVTVENPGPVVAAEEIPGLFEPFRRLGTGDRHAAGGSTGAGLGLSIVRSVALAHRGDVHAASRPAGGLTVRVRIPARPGEDPTESP